MTVTEFLLKAEICGDKSSPALHTGDPMKNHHSNKLSKILIYL